MSGRSIRRLVIFGATGDLAGRYLLPGLAALVSTGAIDSDLEVVGAARSELDDDGFRQHVAERLEKHASEVDPAARQKLVEAISYRQVDLGEADQVAAAVGDDGQPVAAYLALPPSTYATVITTLAEVGLPPGSKVIIEKPFGHDLESARELNELIDRTVGAESVFRVDHVLAMPTVQNLLALRRSSRLLEAVWNSDHIERVDILWDETLALEGRAGFYDGTGALADVVQNHLLQVLAAVAMEPPDDFSPAELHRRRTEALKAVRIPSESDAADRSVRGRYSAGTLAPPPTGSGEDVPSYVNEEGVDPDSGTETFAELVLDLDTPRWTGTPFRLRTGKALGTRHKGVVLRFRRPDRLSDDLSEPADELHIGIDGPTTLEVHLTGAQPGIPPVAAPIHLEGDPPPSELSAYAHLLGAILAGDNRWSVTPEEAEQSWRIVAPFVAAWESGAVALQEYPAGSSGPAKE